MPERCPVASDKIQIMYNIVMKEISLKYLTNFTNATVEAFPVICLGPAKHLLCVKHSENDESVSNPIHGIWSLLSATSRASVCVIIRGDDAGVHELGGGGCVLHGLEDVATHEGGAALTEPIALDTGHLPVAGCKQGH